MSLAHVLITTVFPFSKGCICFGVAPGAACGLRLATLNAVPVTSLSHKGFGCRVRGSLAQKARSRMQHGVQGTDQAGRGGRSARRLTEKRPGPSPAALMDTLHPAWGESYFLICQERKLSLSVALISALLHNYPEHLETSSLTSERCHHHLNVIINKFQRSHRQGSYTILDHRSLKYCSAAPTVLKIDKEKYCCWEGDNHLE